MYSVDASSAHLLLKYSDVFSDSLPDLKAEIQGLNMHKAISIICELIRVRDAVMPPVRAGSFELSVPYEMVLKKQLCGIVANTPQEMAASPLLKKDAHIISVQMLLILLKKVIKYGNYHSLSETEYQITEDDYKKIVQLQLAVAEEIDRKNTEEFDVDHFLYSTYHLNYQRNVANEFLRMHYMLEMISRNPECFDDDVQGEYRDYYSEFTKRYGFTPTQYSSLLFWELNPYYSDINALTYSSMWRNVNKHYENMKDTTLISGIIDTLSQPIESYSEWVVDSESREWDFSRFFEFPLVSDGYGNYISISDITLRNAFFEKIYWLIRDCYPKEDSRAMAFFGRLFEKYIQDLTEAATSSEYQYIREFGYIWKGEPKKSSDAYIRKGTRLLAVEAKGFSVLATCMAKNENVDKNNHKLFLDPVLQADRCLSMFIGTNEDFSDVDSVYIISVTLDNINAVPNYYNTIHDKIINAKQCAETKYFFNLSIEEYEMLMYLLEQQWDIFALLKEYYNESLLRPFSNYLRDKHPEIKMTKFMECLYQEACSTMKDFWRDQYSYIDVDGTTIY